ncbi:MAG: tail fiber domain-containing protein [Alphaproteobacteria bacterium]|nr:tail fiber domain-containing protein [Alphaproteobacteria bacterium]
MLAHKFLNRRRGFTLIELAIVLGVVGVMSAGLWRLMSTGNQQSKDQATAQQQIALINAVKGFLADTTVPVTGHGGQWWMQQMLANATQALPLPGAASTNVTLCKADAAMANAEQFCNYLPTGFTSATTNSYGQTYNIRVLKDNTGGGTYPVNYSFMITTSGGTVIADVDGGRISGLIGGDGGFVYSSAVCTAAASAVAACGALGAWQISDVTAAGPSGYGFPAAQVQKGGIAARTFVSSTTGNSNNQWLARNVITGDSTYTDNTMMTDIFMGTKLAATALSTTGPSIHLQSGYIDGNGPPSTLAPSQISLTTALTTNGAPSLISLNNSACSSLTNANCPPVMVINQGDINVIKGAVYAIKVFPTSDARFKTDIHPITGALDHVMKIDPVAFMYKDTNSHGMGVTAQQLEPIYPDLVENHNGRKYVDYNGLIGPLIGSVQELKHQNDDLRAQLRDQTARLDKLEHRGTAP